MTSTNNKVCEEISVEAEPNKKAAKKPKSKKKTTKTKKKTAAKKTTAKKSAGVDTAVKKKTKYDQYNELQRITEKLRYQCEDGGTVEIDDLKKYFVLLDPAADFTDPEVKQLSVKKDREERT